MSGRSVRFTAGSGPSGNIGLNYRFVPKAAFLNRTPDGGLGEEWQWLINGY